MRVLQWRHNGRDGVSNHQPQDCLLNRLFRRRSKKTSKLCITGLCAGNSPVTGEFPTQMTSNGANVSIGWRHHVDIYIHQIKLRAFNKIWRFTDLKSGLAFSTLCTLSWKTNQGDCLIVNGQLEALMVVSMTNWNRSSDIKVVTVTIPWHLMWCALSGENLL